MQKSHEFATCLVFSEINTLHIFIFLYKETHLFNVDTQEWIRGPDFALPRIGLSMANIHGRIYAFAGKKIMEAPLEEDYHEDGVEMREGLGGWDVVPDLYFGSYVVNAVMVPYNL